METEQAVSAPYDHYPSLEELLRGGTAPVGVSFLIANSSRITLFQSQYGYQIFPQVAAFEIEGPAGRATAVLMTNGTPIPGAVSDNGIRELNIDTTLDDITGLGPILHPTDHQPKKGKPSAQATQASTEAS